MPTRHSFLKTLGCLLFASASLIAAQPDSPKPLTPPATGKIPVAFVLSDGAVNIDFTGPWEVFQDVMIPAQHGSGMEAQHPFQLYIVAESTSPIRISGGMKIVPEYTFANAPAPKVIVIPAQRGVTPALLNWIRTTSKSADLTMSVCNGAFILAQTRLLDGKPATTHHEFYEGFAEKFPNVQLKRGVRFVEHDHIATAAGLSSGIDLALRVVERYYGRATAEKTAFMMEYQSEGWKDASGASNAIYASADTAKVGDLVCGMSVDKTKALTFDYQGKTYYFCSSRCQQSFKESPDRYRK